MVTEILVEVVARLLLHAHPEGFQLDPDRHWAFVNVPDADQIAVVDMDAGRQTTTWRVPGFRDNYPMAFDAASATLLLAFRKPARLVVFDVAAGKPSSILPICGDADDVFFDSKRRRVYVSCGDGQVDALNAVTGDR